MALTADEKEAIMAARGEAAAPVVKSKTRRYEIRFADGKSATALDMQGEPLEAFVSSTTRMFKPDYVVSVTAL